MKLYNGQRCYADTKLQSYGNDKVWFAKQLIGSFAHNYGAKYDMSIVAFINMTDLIKLGRIEQSKLALCNDCLERLIKFCDANNLVDYRQLAWYELSPLPKNYEYEIGERSVTI